MNHALHTVHQGTPTERGQHACHSKGTGEHGMGHGSASMYLRRFWIVTALLIPLALTNPPVAAFLHIPTLALGTLVQFGLATVIFGFSFVFFEHAWHEV